MNKAHAPPPSQETQESSSIIAEGGLYMLIFHKRRFFQSKAGAVAFQKMLGYGLFLCLEQDSTSFDYIVEALMAGKDANFVKESLIKSIRASGERFFRLSRKRPRRRSIATSRGI